MYKLLLGIALALSLHAGLAAEPCAHNAEARISVFVPFGKLFRSIYGDYTTCYELEIRKGSCKKHQLWGNIDWISVGGRTVTFHTKTKYQNLNLSCGGNYLFHIYDCLQLYLGLGLNNAFVYVINHSPYVKSPVFKNGFGIVGKTGIYYKSQSNINIDLFIDYLYQKMQFQHLVQLGGAKLGIGCAKSF